MSLDRNSNCRSSFYQANIDYVPKRWTKAWHFFTVIDNFIFGFIGSFAGWVCLYVLIELYMNNKSSLGVTELSLFAIVLLGLTNNLPLTIFGLIQSISLIGNIAAKWIKEKTKI